MYAKHTPRAGCDWRFIVSIATTLALSVSPQLSWAQQQSGTVVRNISHANERMEMTVNTSQILTLGTRIPRMVVNNPELVTATPISDTQIQIAARKPGVTQINLWDENGKVYSVDLVIFGDVRELEMALKQMFPGSSLKVVRLTNSLVLEGEVDRPEIVSTIRTLAEDYAPKVVNNITVGGVQQVMLKVKVMEVSRTKLRRLGFDFVARDGRSFFASGVSGLLTSVNPPAGPIGVSPGTSQVQFRIVDGNSSFFGFLEAMQRNNLSKILADPTLTTVSGRPASFNVGGELPILVPSGLGQTTIEYKKFGTQVDFVPIVLGDGNIRLEVRPRVSEIDDTRGVTVGGFTVPALKVREVDTGVEMKAGQTLALAGLIQERVEAQNQGIPIISDLPLVGAAFRHVQEEVNEVELLILVTPEFADAMDPCEAPKCGPGMETMSPTDCELYYKGYLEVPACGPCGAATCNPCNLGNGLGCELNGGSGCNACNGAPNGSQAMATDASSMEQAEPIPVPDESLGPTYQNAPLDGNSQGPMPDGATDGAIGPTPASGARGDARKRSDARAAESDAPRAARGGVGKSMPDPAAAVARPPRYVASKPGKSTYRYNPTPPRQGVNSATSTPGLIGPIGYDVQK